MTGKMCARTQQKQIVLNTTFIDCLWWFYFLIGLELVAIGMIKWILPQAVGGQIWQQFCCSCAVDSWVNTNCKKQFPTNLFLVSEENKTLFHSKALLNAFNLAQPCTVNAIAITECSQSTSEWSSGPQGLRQNHSGDYLDEITNCLKQNRMLLPEEAQVQARIRQIHWRLPILSENRSCSRNLQQWNQSVGFYA